MKWIKKNKFTVIAIVIFVLLTIVGVKVKDIFFPNQRSAVYGDRLDGKIPVESSVYEEVKTKLKENKIVEEVTINEIGRRIDIIVTVTNAAGKSESKKLLDNILDSFTEEQIKYYDYQLFVKKADKAENDFPMIASKQHTQEVFSWTKDREKVESSESDK